MWVVGVVLGCVWTSTAPPPGGIADQCSRSPGRRQRTAILILARRCPLPRLGSRSQLSARGKRVAPESCRTGHLRASSPLRSAVRHGLVDTRLAPPRNLPRAAASRRFSPFPARTGPTKARTAGLSLRPLRPLAAAGPARPSIPRLGARMRRMPAGLRPHRPAVRRSARIRSPHASESARSAPGPRGLRRLRSRPRRPTRRFPQPGNFLPPTFSVAPVFHRSLLPLFPVLHYCVKHG